METITIAGEVLKAQKQAAGEPLIINQFILANIAGQNHEDEIDRTRGLPDAEDIVYTSEVTRAAYVAESEVVYSLFMGTGVGGFSFNTLYLVCTEDNNTVFAIATLPETPKIADDIDSGTRGTSMTRNFALAFDGAQAITELTVEAEAWQMEFEEATETVRGIAEIATHAETQVGLDDQRIVTPLKLGGFWDSVRQWENIEEKPTEFPPEPHTHVISDILDFSFIGAVMAFASENVPPGWLVCDGSTVSRVVYQQLYAEIGLTYGDGDGINTFNIPDLRGQFIRGFDSEGTVDHGRAFGSIQEDASQKIEGRFGGYVTGWRPKKYGGGFWSN